MAAISVEPCTFALFGALGDLALRKLFPALYQLDRAGLLHADSRLLALAREAGDGEQHLATIEAHLRRFVPEADIEPGALGRFLARLSYVRLDFLQADGYQALAEQVAADLPLIAYFATPASVYGAICENRTKPAWPPVLGSCWKSPSVTTWSRPVGSTMPWRGSSRKVGSIVSITTWARRRCRTSSHCVLPTACSKPSGTRTLSPTWKSPWLKRWGSKGAGAISTRPASCAT